MSETNYPIGRLLRSGITGFVAGCPIVEQERPSFGALVRAPLGPNDSIYGVVHELSILDDGLVRQLVTRDQPVDATVIADNRVNRTVPMEISVLAVGHSKDGVISHALAPRAPLSLDAIHQCSPEEIVAFSNHGSFGYLRHLLRDTELPVGELVAAHLRQAAAANVAAGKPEWKARVTQELIALLRDDYTVLMQVLGSLADEFEA